MKQAYSLDGKLQAVPASTPTRNRGGVRYLLTDEDKAKEAAKEAKYLSEAPQRALAAVIEARKKEYGTAEQQIEYITEYGLAAWQGKVAAIKAANPKGA